MTKKSVKKNWLNWIIVIGVIVLVVGIYMWKSSAEVDASIAQCIGERATLYVQIGCSHCNTQEQMFGENVDLLNIVNCNLDWTKCSEIEATPTWIIGNESYRGTKSIETLRELTGC